MRIRLGIHYERLPPAPAAPVPPAEGYATLLARAERAEQLGFDSIWVGERPEPPDASLPAALPLCAAIAARTTRLRVGTAVLPLPLYHPLRVAEDAASLDALSGGRLDLGVGLGDDPEGFHGYGVPRSARGDRLEEAIEVLRRALSGEAVTFRGRHFDVQGIQVVPAPVQPGGPPLWIGAARPLAVKRVARLGAGLLATLPEVAEDYLEAWADEGRPLSAARVVLRLGLVLAGSGGRPRDPAAGIEILDPEAALQRLRAAILPLRAAGQLELLFPGAPGLEAPAVDQSLQLLSELRSQLLPRPSA